MPVDLGSGADDAGDMTSVTPVLERATTTLEDAAGLDGAVEALRPGVTELFGSGTRGKFCVATGSGTRSTPC